jgi:hypothetical protein
MEATNSFGLMMNNERSLQPVEESQWSSEQLRLEIDRARAALAAAEAELAAEQAAVNAFRMHCRLKLDDLVDQLLQLRSEKESLLVKLELLRQGVDPAFLDNDDPLMDEVWTEETAAEDEPLLPTDTPRDKAAEKRLFRELARRFHPDLAATAFERSYRTTIMAAINNAYAEGDSEALYDLAGELTPEEVAGLARISNVEVWRTHHSINKMRRLERKARRQLAVLRQENTARLWRRVQTLDENDEDGWSVIRRELEQAISRRQMEIDQLSKQVEKLQEFDQED